MGLKWLRRGEMKLKTRCVDGTYYVKNVQQTIIGNSMLEYASASLDETEVIGNEILVLSMEKTSEKAI
jgi:hypothetical protein